MKIHKVTVIDRGPGNDLHRVVDLVEGGLYFLHLNNAKAYCEDHPLAEGRISWYPWKQEGEGLLAFGDFRVQTFEVVESFVPSVRRDQLKTLAQRGIERLPPEELAAMIATAVVDPSKLDN